MFARVSSTQVSPERVNDLVVNFQEATPTEISGMKRAYLMVDREQGKIITVTLWETKSAMEDAARLADDIRASALDVGEKSSWNVATYEVADEVISSDSMAA